MRVLRLGKANNLYGMIILDILATTGCGQFPNTGESAV